MGKAPCCDKNGVRKGAWTKEEDDILVNYVKQFGHGTWRSLPKKAGLLRCGKSCRLRWTNYLRPGIKRGPFSQEEEDTIIRLHTILGNKWAAIASQIRGRTDNEVKNYWNTHLKKRFLASKQHDNQTRFKFDTNNIKPEPATRHMIQWESARLEAEARLSVGTSVLNSSLNSNADYFLNLWNSEIGRSFREIKLKEGGNCQSPASQTSSFSKFVSSFNATMQTEHMAQKQDDSYKGKPEDTMMVGSDSSSHYELIDPNNSVLELLMDYPGECDLGFLQRRDDGFAISMDNNIQDQGCLF
ncbi:hypothetical protein UlMin_024611 [Ulmus minor]